jgi:hypothetical protein
MLFLVRSALVALLAGIFAQSLVAQTSSSAPPATPLYQQMLLSVRDSINALQGDLWTFGRDLKQAGNETVVSRAARVQVRCVTTTLELRRTRPSLLDDRVPVKARGQARRLVGEIDRLSTVLRRDCEAGLRLTGPGVWADSLRAWGPYRKNQLERGIRDYHRAAGAFAGALGVRLDPK